MSVFKNNYIQIDDLGIDFLRNNYIFKHIDFIEIDSYCIKDGFLLKNRRIILIIGLLLIISGLTVLINEFSIISVFFDFHFNRLSKGLGLILILPIFLIILGGLILFQSFIRSKILIINTKEDSFDIRLKEFQFKNQVNDIAEFLNSKIRY